LSLEVVKTGLYGVSIVTYTAWSYIFLLVLEKVIDVLLYPAFLVLVLYDVTEWRLGPVTSR